MNHNPFLEIYLGMTASKLVQKPVTVKLLPAEDMPGNYGYYTTVKGVRTIYLRDNLDPDADQTLKVFLHECCHALLHSDALSMSTKIAPSLAGLAEVGQAIRETQAEKLTATWLKIVEPVPGNMFEKLKFLRSKANLPRQVKG